MIVQLFPNQKELKIRFQPRSVGRLPRDCVLMNIQDEAMDFWLPARFGDKPDQYPIGNMRMNRRAFGNYSPKSWSIWRAFWFSLVQIGQAYHQKYRSTIRRLQRQALEKSSISIRHSPSRINWIRIACHCTRRWLFRRIPYATL